MWNNINYNKIIKLSNFITTYYNYLIKTQDLSNNDYYDVFKYFKIIADYLIQIWNNVNEHNEKIQDNLNLTGVANLSADNLTINGSSTALSVTGSLLTNSTTLHGNMNPSYSTNPCNNVYLSGNVALVQ